MANKFIESINLLTPIGINNYHIYISLNNNEVLNKYEIIYNVSIEETYSCEGRIYIIVNPCYNSCERCEWINNGPTYENHNCIKCKEGYYPSPFIESNCYTEQEMKQINSHYYLDKNISQFIECNSNCKTCNGSNNYNCLSCNNSLCLYNGKCINRCPKKTFKSKDIELNDICIDCHQNCKSCHEKGNSSYMNCDTCPNNFIKYKNKLF